MVSSQNFGHISLEPDHGPFQVKWGYPASHYTHCILRFTYVTVEPTYEAQICVNRYVDNRTNF